jgi:hypothetical protein
VAGSVRKLFAGGSDGNARLTAAVAVVLTVLLLAEGVTLLGGVRQLLVPHIFIGLLLIPPIALKLASTGWRMLAYYRRIDEYVRKGPPHAFLRILVAPILVASTVVMFATGIAAAWVGHGGILLGLHKASFVVWGIAFGIHFLAHALKLPRLVEFDWWRPDALGGRRLRRYVLAGALVAGLVVAIGAFPLAHHWHQGFGFALDDR